MTVRRQSCDIHMTKQHTLASIVGRCMRFFLVAGLMAWGVARMEALLHRYVDRLGWATVALVGLGVL